MTFDEMTAALESASAELEALVARVETVLDFDAMAVWLNQSYTRLLDVGLRRGVISGYCARCESSGKLFLDPFGFVHCPTCWNGEDDTATPISREDKRLALYRLLQFEMHRRGCKYEHAKACSCGFRQAEEGMRRLLGLESAEDDPAADKHRLNGERRAKGKGKTISA